MKWDVEVKHFVPHSILTQFCKPSSHPQLLCVKRC
jgi:hypothetical protein